MPPATRQDKFPAFAFIACGWLAGAGGAAKDTRRKTFESGQRHEMDSVIIYSGAACAEV